MAWLGEYDPKVYASLGNVKENARKIVDAEILGLGRILVKYGYQSVLSVSVNYKLVDLELEEVVIQTHETGVHDPSRIHQKKLAAKPIVVALDAIGKWHPVIYGIGNFDHRPFLDKEFLQEVKWYLMVHDLWDKLMLRLVPQPDSEQDSSGDVIYLEIKYSGDKHSVLMEFRRGKEPSMEKGKLIKTMFSFKSFIEDEIFSYCSGYFYDEDPLSLYR